MIPKVIHYCWFGPNEISRLEHECIASWRKFLPDYSIKLWNERNFNINEYSFVKQAYECRKYAFVSDVARLHALYHEGGIYLDTDMLLLKDLRDLFDYPFVIGEHRPGELAVGVFGCERQNKVVEILLNEYRKIEFNPQRPHTIPEHFDTIVKKHQLKNDIKVYSVDYFYSLPFECRGEDFKKYLTDNSAAVHLWNHSWKTEFSTLRDGYFLTSFGLYLKNIFSFRVEYWSWTYNRRYFNRLYMSVLKFIKAKLR